jgi:DNA-binding NarL/FixJ family response regulator
MVEGSVVAQRGGLMTHEVRIALVVDDHPFMRRAVRDALLDVGFTTVHETGTLAEAQQLLAEMTPALAVLDLRLPDGSPLELCARLRAAGIPVMAFTSADDAYTVRAAFGAGITGYVLKSSAYDVVLHAVQEVLAGRVYADARVVSLLVQSVQQAPNVDINALTSKEIALLRLVAQGLSNAEIGAQLGITALSVKGILTRLGRKLGTGDRTQMVAEAMRAELLA